MMQPSPPPPTSDRFARKLAIAAALAVLVPTLLIAFAPVLLLASPLLLAAAPLALGA
jgi:hypothetical protein